MKSKLFIFIIVLFFIASLNFAFAVDENDTQIISDSDDAVLEMDENVDVESTDESQDICEKAIEDNVVDKKDTSNVITADAPTIKMNGVTKRVNGGIYYQASFYDSSGNPLKNRNVWFTLDNNVDLGYNVITDSNGVALLKAKIANGNYRLNAFNLDTGDKASSYIKVFDVITGGKDISMYYDDGTTYKVRVYDDNGNPVKSGQKVTFTINGKKYVRSTDKNGYAKLKIPSLPGSYVIRATYNDFSVSNNLYVKNVLKGKTGKVSGKSKVKFKVTFLGKNKKNKLIKVKFNKKTYKAKTNKKGVATFNLKTPKKLGRYSVVVSYKKTKAYYVYTQYRV
jgi:hypothetical protein